MTKKVEYPKLRRYSNVLCVNTSTAMVYRWIKEDIQKCLNGVGMDMMFVGWYKTKRGGYTTAVIAFNDELIPSVLEQLLHRYSWFENIWVCERAIDVNEWASDYVYDYDPDVTTPIPAAKSSKSNIVITTGRLIRYDATEAEVQGKKPRKKANKREVVSV